jgi:anti-anti-sigma regulatory factor
MSASVLWLVIDFSMVTFVNTPVWAVVVEYYQHARNSKTGLALAGLKSRVAASFNIVQLGNFIANYPTVEEAVEAMKA